MSAVPEGKRQILLAGMRCAAIRLKLLELELEEIGIALKLNIISPEDAVGCLHDINALQFINPSIAAMPEKEAA